MNTSFSALCQAAADRWEVPALAVSAAVADDVETVFLGCDERTRFRIASVTKPATAALVLSVLDPEETTGVWPEDVRIRHLLSHTSGFDCELPDRDNLKHGTGDDALSRCAEELALVPRLVGADEIWSYANTGYWLAGWLAAERLGATFEEALGARVLEPAGLAATAFDEPEIAGTGADASPDPYPRSRRPSGGLVAPLADVAALGRFLLRFEVFARMAVPHGKPVGGVYGLGLFGERVGGLDVWGHSGSYGGFQSSLLLVPERDAVFAGLTNGSKGAKALREAEDAFLERATGSPRRQPPFVKLAPEQYARLEGTYESGEGTWVVEYPERSDGLVVHHEGEEDVALALGASTFAYPVGAHVGERFDFPRDGLARFSSRIARRAA